MKRNKRAQGLSLDMIVIGAISIVVLVVIITIFVNSMTQTGEKLEGGYTSCEGAGKSLDADEQYNATVLSPFDMPAEYGSVEELCRKMGGRVYTGPLSDVSVSSGEVCCYGESLNLDLIQ